MSVVDVDGETYVGMSVIDVDGETYVGMSVKTK